MGFERYTQKSNGKGGGGPRVSLRKSGSIGLNGKAVEEYLDAFNWAYLYFDEENNRVGIQPTGEDHDEAYAVQKRDKEGHGGSITATSFMREFDLIPDKTEQYRALWHEEEELIYIDVEDPVLVYDG